MSCRDDEKGLSTANLYIASVSIARPHSSLLKVVDDRGGMVLWSQYCRSISHRTEKCLDSVTDYRGFSTQRFKACCVKIVGRPSS